jgi:hypothetical protein
LTRDWIDKPAVARRLTLDPHRYRQSASTRASEGAGRSALGDDHQRQPATTSERKREVDDLVRHIESIIAERQRPAHELQRARGRVPHGAEGMSLGR